MQLRYLVGVIAILPTAFAAPVLVKEEIADISQRGDDHIESMILRYNDDLTSIKKRDAKVPTMIFHYNDDLTSVNERDAEVPSMIFRYNSDLTAAKEGTQD